MINLNAVLVAALLGTMLSAVILSAIGWRRQNKTIDNSLIRYLVIVVLITNIANPICFWADGTTNKWIAILLRVSEFEVYISNVIIGYLWWNIVTTHMNRNKNKRHCIYIYITCILSTLLLIVNLFAPIVYRFDENNVYHRGPLAIVYTIIELIFAADGIVQYLLSKRDGGILKFFPVWQFVLPVVIGTLIQFRYYGISLTIPCMSISTLGLVLGLKNMRIFGDPLTNTYNRFYLNYLKEKVSHYKDGVFAIMMMDLNDFKSINDLYGHAEGDIALVQSAKIFADVVGTYGNVIRYAGDEFVILLNTDDLQMVEQINRRIRDAMDAYNQNSGKPYRLSVSIGSCIINLKYQSVEEVMNDVDVYMYEDKKRFYSDHKRHGEVLT